MIESFEFSAIAPVLPELVLAVGAMALLLFGTTGDDRASFLIVGLSVALLVLAGVLVATMPADKAVALGGSFVVDEFARFLKILTLIGSAVAIVLSLGFLARQHRRLFEFPILILLATTGMMMMISAGDLIALYL